MKKVLIGLGVGVVIAVGIYFTFFNSVNESKITKEKTETFTEKIQEAGEPLDYNFGREHKVVKAIVSDQANSKPVIAKRLLELTPFSAQALTIRRMLDQLQDNPAIDSETYEKMESVVNKYFAEDVMKEMLEKALVENLSREELAEVLAWRETPIAQQMSALNEKAMDPDFAEELASELKNYDTNAVSQERKDQLVKLDEVTGGTQNAIDNMTTVQLGMMKSMAPGKGNALTAEQMEEAAVSMKEGFEKNLRPQIEAAAIWLYKDTPKDDIDKTIEANSSSAVQKSSEAIQEANNKMLSQFGSEFGSTMIPSE